MQCFDCIDAQENAENVHTLKALALRSGPPQESLCMTAPQLPTIAVMKRDRQKLMSVGTVLVRVQLRAATGRPLGSRLAPRRIPEGAFWIKLLVWSDP